MPVLSRGQLQCQVGEQQLHDVQAGHVLPGRVHHGMQEVPRGVSRVAGERVLLRGMSGRALHPLERELELLGLRGRHVLDGRSRGVRALPLRNFKQREPAGAVLELSQRHVRLRRLHHGKKPCQNKKQTY